MKTLLSFAFGLHVLLGNVCMMNVAYAAPMDDAHHHASSHMRCGGNDCTPMASHDTRHAPAQRDCIDGHCLFTDTPETVGLLDFDVTPDMAAFSPALITQALLVLGTPTAYEPAARIDTSQPFTTVVLMQ